MYQSSKGEFFDIEVKKIWKMIDSRKITKKSEKLVIFDYVYAFFDLEKKGHLPSLPIFYSFFLISKALI